MSPIVLLHGFTGAPQSWSRVVKRLPPHVRVYSPSMYGHRGHPEKYASTFLDEVDRLIAWIRDEVGEASHLCGYSLGGRLGLGMLARESSLFLSATILSAHPGLESAEARESRVQQDERWAMLLEQQGIEAFINEWERQPLFASQNKVDRAHIFEQREVRRAHRAVALAQSLRCLGLGQMPFFRKELRSVTLPVRIVVGELDETFVVVGRQLLSLLPYATLDVLGASGHNLLLECPQSVADAIRMSMEAIPGHAESSF